MAGELITDGWQLELRSLLMGFDTDYDLAELEGIGVPEVRVSDRPRPRAHGVEPGEDWAGARTIIATLDLLDEDDTALWALKNALKAAWRPRPTGVETLALRLGGVTYLAYGRPRGCRFTDAGPGLHTEAVCVFAATDPLLYSATETSVQLALATSTGGLAFPFGFPLGFGSAFGGIVTLTNEGEAETLPHATFHGPLTNPRLESITAGRTVEFDLTVAAGDFLEVDFDARTVLLNGTASRYQTFRGTAADWWALEPGDNEIRFAAGSGTGTCDLRFRSAWF